MIGQNCAVSPDVIPGFSQDRCTLGDFGSVKCKSTPLIACTCMKIGSTKAYPVFIRPWGLGARVHLHVAVVLYGFTPIYSNYPHSHVHSCSIPPRDRRDGRNTAGSLHCISGKPEIPLYTSNLLNLFVLH